jgi:hypothetical protein
MYSEVVADLSGNYGRGLRFSYAHRSGAGFPEEARKQTFSINQIKMYRL